MDNNLKIFHTPLYNIDENGEFKGKLYPENNSTDVIIGNINPAENLDESPASKEGERLEETLAIIKKFYNNLIGVGNIERSVTDSPETVPENSLASGAALKTVYDQLNELETNISDQESEVIKRAPIDHSSQDPKYGLGTDEKYGHLKISDEYETALSDQAYVAASQKAINEAYTKLSEITENLSSSKADNYHASEDVKYGVGSSTKYGHLKISDDYVNEDGSETPNGVAASLYGLREAYNSLKEIVAEHKSELAGIGKYGHVKLTDGLDDSDDIWEWDEFIDDPDNPGQKIPNPNPNPNEWTEFIDDPDNPGTKIKNPIPNPAEWTEFIDDPDNPGQQIPNPIPKPIKKETEGMILSSSGTKKIVQSITNVQNSITILNGGGGGIENANTVFNADGSITVTAETSDKTTTFNDDGSITDKTIFYKDNTKKEVIDRVTAKTTFNADGSISQTVTKINDVDLEAQIQVLKKQRQMKL